ncbi:MAG: TonB-dependent receptor plug [Ferruginibacter sp.]|nr:TonB-dependent receptor plug [Ferruginibacter sp.]
MEFIACCNALPDKVRERCRLTFKMLLVMKLTALLFFAACLQISAKTVGQNITLSEKNASLKKVLKQIKTQTGVAFFYDEDLLKKSNRVDIVVKNAVLEDVLTMVFEKQGLSYEIIGNKLITIKERVPITIPRVVADLTIPPDTTITGIVTDEKGAPMIGVTVIVKGMLTRSAITNEEGRYSIRASGNNATLVFSYVGYTDVSHIIGSAKPVNIKMKPKMTIIDDIVVVGYGTRKKSDLTGSIAVVNEKALRNIPAGNIGTLLQGTAAGLSVLKAGGNNHPASTPTIRIRGERSLGADSNPLIVLDGIPYSGSLNDINQDDIVSAQILKDASATAIYGSRGSNGVILINTRRGKIQKAVVTYSGYSGFNKILGEYDVMDAKQFITFRKWAKINGSVPNTYTGIDDPKLIANNSQGVFSDPVEMQLYLAGQDSHWQDGLYKSPLLINHQVGVNGGTETTRYDMSLGYYDAGGVYTGQGITRYTAKLSLDHIISKTFKIGISSLNNYTIIKGLNVNPVNNYVQATPFGSAYNADGTLAKFLAGSNQNVWNPLTDLVPGAIIDDVTRLGTFTTAYMDITLPAGFKYRLNTGIQISPEKQGKFYGSNTTKQLGQPNYGFNSNTTGYNYTVDNILTYDKTIARDHVVNFTGLYSIQKSQSENNNVSYRSLLADYIQYYNPQYASSITSNGFYSKWSILSYMGRLNYTLKDRYLATFTIRSDGSSRLADGNKWHQFPSGALAWNIAREKFMANSKHVSSLKLSASYGTTANTSIGTYETIGSLTSNYYNYGGENVLGTYPDPQGAGNTTLGWENTTSSNLRLDFGLFRNRVSGSVEWYKQTTDDILLFQTLPATSGYSRIRNNIGQTKNIGMEFNLSTINAAGSGKETFSWVTDFNVFFNRNKITSLASGAKQDLANNWFVGSTKNIIFDYTRAGIWQNTPEDLAMAQLLGLTTTQAAYLTGPGSLVGTVKVADINGDNKITAADRGVVGNREPRLEGGITNRFAYKNFDFSFITYFKLGGILESPLHSGFTNTFQGVYNNLDVDYWTPDNPSNYWPKPNSTLQFANYLGMLDNFGASYLKIRTITVGYTLPESAFKLFKVKSARFYATASNPFTFFSDYKKLGKGLDPETNYNLDVNTPAYWSMLFGLNVSF